MYYSLYNSLANTAKNGFLVIPKPMVRVLLFTSLFLYAFQSHAQKVQDSLDLHQQLTKALSIRLNKPDSSIYLAKQALQQISPSSDYLNGYANYIISYSNWVKANYKLSTEYGFRALRYMENTEFSYEKSLILLELARTFLDLENPQEGLKYLKKAALLAQEAPDDTRLMANYYREFSFYLVEVNSLDSSILIINEGLTLYEKLGDRLNKSVLLSRLARIQLLKKNYKETYRLTKQASVLDSLVNNQRGLGFSYLYLASALEGLGKIDSAVFYAKKAIRKNEEIGNWRGQYTSHRKLSELYVHDNKLDKAIEQLLLADVVKDSLYNSRASGQIEEMKILYETENKDNIIALLEKDQALQKQQTRVQWVFVGFLVALILLLGILLFVVFRSQRIQKNTNKELEEKNKSIEQQREEMQLQAEKLQELNQLKSKLFSVIGHDLRGPINSLQALLDLFSKNLLSQEEFLLHSDKLKASVNITQRTLENLLNWSLSQMEGIRTRPSVMDVKSSADEAGRLLTDIASRKNIQIVNTLESPLLVFADPDQVQLILRNLIHNGIKFSKANSTVTISATSKNGECRISVTDEGIGMSPEELERLQIQKEHFTKIGTLQEKGTGLGILLCKEFVTRNEGTLEIQSEAGKGTIISFTLPLA
jgi:two-component system sensor histidine kinase/response regulator